MRVIEQIYSQAEEFLNEISNIHDSEDLEDLKESLQSRIEREMDGHEFSGDLDLICDIHEMVFDIWRLISEEEKAENHNLGDYFEELISTLNELEEEMTEDVTASDDDFEEEPSEENEE